MKPFIQSVGKKSLKVLAGLLALAAFLAGSAQAQTWLSGPGSGDWNTGTNWDTSTIPNSQSAAATFDTSSTNSVTLSAGVSLGSLTFTASAPQYVLDTNSNLLAFFGQGIINNSSAAQSINNSSHAQLNLYNNASLGNAWVYSGFTSYVNFYNNSTAGSAWIDSNNNDGIVFNDNSTAGSAWIDNHGNSNLAFYGMSSAGSATILNQTASYLYVQGSSSTTLVTLANSNITNTGNMYIYSDATAGAATITTNSGGDLYFYSGSQGGTAQLTMNGTGFMDISFINGPLTVGSIAGSGSVSLGNHNLTTGSNNLNTTFSGVLSDGGAAGGAGGLLTKIGTGTLTLSGANVYTGGTTLAGGTLALGNNSALGTGDLTMESGTVLQNGLANLSIANNINLAGISGIADAHGQGWTLTGTVSGSGALNVINGTGSGVLYLTGANTYTGGTGVNNNGILNIQDDGNIANNGLNLNGGTLQAGTGGLSLSENVTLGSGGGTFDENGGNSSLSGVLSGTGSLSVTNSTGTGSVTLSGTNTYSGGTSITGGIVDVDTGSSLGTGLVHNIAATLQFVDNANAGSATILTQGVTTPSYVQGALNFLNNASAGSASIYNSTYGYVNFYNSSTASNAQMYSGYNAYILFHDTSTAANADIDNNNGDGLYFENNSTAGNADILNRGNSGVNFFNAASAGNATIDNQAYSYIYFYGDSSSVYSTAANANITNTGTIYFENYATAGAATITTNNGGIVYFLNNSTGGTAQFTVNGTGYLDLSNLSSSSITIGSLAGSGFVSMGSKNLVEGSNDLDTIFTGILSNGGGAGGTGGSLTKIGTGSLTLSGASVYTGGTDLEAGTLVAAHASAFGTGNVTANGGTLAFSGPLTVNIGGNYTQGAAATLQMGLGPSVANWDLLNVTGTASLDGTFNLAAYGNYVAHVNESVTIIDASSVSGTFATVNDNVPKSGVSLVYNPGSVVLELTSNAPSFQSLGNTGNQKNIGGALDVLAGGSASSPLVVFLNGEANSALPGDYDLISPSNLTPLYQMSFGTAQVEAGMVEGRVSQLFGGDSWASSDTAWNGRAMFAADMPAGQEASMAKDLEPQRWSAFANGLGNFGTVTGDGNGAGYQYSTGGVAAGADYRFSKDFVGGLLLGYSSSGTSASTGSVKVTGGQAGLYAGWKQGTLQLSALAAGGTNSYTTQRTAVGGTASGSTQGTQFSGQLGVRYGLKVEEATVSPFVTGQYTNVAFDAFTETGSLAPLSFGAQSEGYLTSDLGASADRKWDLGGDASLSPMVSAAWEHVYQGNLDSLAANFGSGSNFTVNGPATGSDAAVLGAGLKASFGKGFSAFVEYQGKLALTNYTEQNVSGGVNVGF